MKIVLRVAERRAGSQGAGRSGGSRKGAPEKDGLVVCVRLGLWGGRAGS